MLGHKIVFFDGDCLLCKRSVNFLLKKDNKKRLKYASLHSDLADDVKRKYLLMVFPEDTIVFSDEARIYTKSTAVLKIAGYLKLPYALFSVFLVIPQSWRDRIYDIVAFNRTRWFRQKVHCQVPNPDILSRIVG
jgi:predicted DCC family thiol-disulfide oxidoreductase YuxK